MLLRNGVGDLNRQLDKLGTKDLEYLQIRHQKVAVCVVCQVYVLRCNLWYKSLPMLQLHDIATEELRHRLNDLVHFEKWCCECRSKDEMINKCTVVSNVSHGEWVNNSKLTGE